MSIGLVDYAGSDSESDEVEKEEILEPEVKKKKWEIAEAPKPPPKKKLKGPVKISLPTLADVSLFRILIESDSTVLFSF